MVMVKLNQNESMLLLIAKGWEHKDVKRNKNEGKMNYINRVLDHEYLECHDDVFAIYSNLAEKLLSSKVLISIIDEIKYCRDIKIIDSELIGKLSIVVVYIVWLMGRLGKLV